MGCTNSTAVAIGTIERKVDPLTMFIPVGVAKVDEFFK